MIRIDEIEDSVENTIRIETKGEPEDISWQLFQFLLDFYKRYPSIIIGTLKMFVNRISNIEEDK